MSFAALQVNVMGLCTLVIPLEDVSGRLGMATWRHNDFDVAVGDTKDGGTMLELCGSRLKSDRIRISNTSSLPSSWA